MVDSLTAAELTIDLTAVAANWARLSDVAAGVDVAAMVKADGYGLGATEVATALARAGCKEFFVADVEEGIELRSALPTAPIFILAGALDGTLDDLLEHRLTPVLISGGQIDAWRRRAEDAPRPLRASIHLDTGMNRTGLDATDTASLLADPRRLDGLEVAHVMSHLASADDAETPQNARQLEAFRAIRRRLPMGRASLANTPGIALGADFHLDHVRPGIGLYGADPSPGQTLGLVPVVGLHAPVLQTRLAGPDETVGYGATHTLVGERRLATLGVGYGDGVMRAQSDRGHVAFAGHRAPVVGRVSMDLLTVDITDIPEEVPIRPGTAAELIGPTITIDDVATASGTIAYEVLTGLGHRYRRRYRR